METLTKEQERDFAEKCLKAKLNTKIILANSPDYTFNKIIEAMEDFAILMVADKERRIKELLEIEHYLVIACNDYSTNVFALKERIKELEDANDKIKKHMKSFIRKQRFKE